MTHRFEVDRLLAETAWLSGLARQLVARRNEAEDLVQETLSTAIEAAPATGPALRGWLRTVMVNRWRDGRRADRSRMRREQLCTGQEQAPAADDVVARAELHGELVRAVLELEEPHRTCLLLRFFENLPPRVIARRLGVPVATVHSRLQRALARLRERYRRQRGSPWRAALLPLLPRSIRLSTVVLGVSLVNAIGKLTLLLAAALLAWWIWPSSMSPQLEPGGVLAASSSASFAETERRPSVAAAESPPERVVVPRALETSHAPVTAAEATRLHGRVIDLAGAGIAGVRLALLPARVEQGMVSGPDGIFVCERQPGADRVVAADTRWGTVLAGAAAVQGDRLVTVVVAPRVDLGGEVVDSAGAGLAGAAVAVHLPPGLGAQLGILLDYSLPRTWRAIADAQGHFVLTEVPAVAAAMLSAGSGGYQTQLQPVPAASDGNLRFVLERPGTAATLVQGLVVDVWGGAVAGARVSAGNEVAICDAQGAFAIDVSHGPGLARLVAVAAGMQPAMWLPEHDATGRPLWPGKVVLQLGPSPLSMRGRVVDADGRPLSGAKVWIADPTLVGQEDDVVLAETLLGRRDRPFWAFVLSDDAGAFRLEGLTARDYEVRALDPATLAATSLSGVRAGRDDVELRLAEPLLSVLQGRVVARDGTPLAHVKVTLQRPALELRVPDGTRDEWATGQSLRTDQDGAFHFERVPRQGIEVFASGEEILFAGRMLTAGDDADHFVLQADRRVHLQVELGPPLDRGDHVRVLDAAGLPMVLRVMRGESSYTSRNAEVHDGRSQILSLGEGASTAVLLRGDVEVARLPIQLALVGVNTVRF